MDYQSFTEMSIIDKLICIMTCNRKQVAKYIENS